MICVASHPSRAVRNSGCCQPISHPIAAKVRLPNNMLAINGHCEPGRAPTRSVTSSCSPLRSTLARYSLPGAYGHTCATGIYSPAKSEFPSMAIIRSPSRRIPSAGPPGVTRVTRGVCPGRAADHPTSRAVPPCSQSSGIAMPSATAHNTAPPITSLRIVEGETKLTASVAKSRPSFEGCALFLSALLWSL